MQQSYEMMMKDYSGPVLWLRDATDSLDKLKKSSSEVSVEFLRVLSTVHCNLIRVWKRNVSTYETESIFPQEKELIIFDQWVTGIGDRLQLE